MLTTRCQKVLAIKADGHESLQSLNGCARVTDDWAGLRNLTKIEINSFLALDIYLIALYGRYFRMRV